MYRAHFGELLVGRGSISHNVVKATKVKVGVWLFGVELHGDLKLRLCIFVPILLKINRSEIHVSNAYVFAYTQRRLQKIQRFFDIAVSQLYVTKIGQSISVLWIEFQFALESRRGIFIL